MEDTGKRLLQAIVADFEDISHRGKNTKAILLEMEQDAKEDPIAKLQKTMVPPVSDPK